ncbi:Sua5/YciO/YrdC/YwlC family protein [[Mycoplasma] mobile]|nr:Sua5/YciO/YrdC/YwlC family protein [[Mycoplasma] mobile]
MNKFKDVFIVSTDTVTGIGISIHHENPNLLYELKNRPKNKKIAIVVGSIEQARKMPFWNEKAEAFANILWPGAVTLIVNDQAIRMPNCKKLQDFIIDEGPFFLTSANKSGEDPIEINNAQKIFPEVTKIYNFCKGNGKSSIIIDIETKKRLR